jgi:hypothetical protein
MGLRFDLASANWVAHILDPSGVPPRLGNEHEERETLRRVIRKLEHSFFSSGPWEFEFRDRAHRVERLLEHSDGAPPEILLRELREFLGYRPWTSLIVPSGDDHKLDRHLGSEMFLRHLVHIRPDDPGLILQVEDMPKGPFALVNVFPAFRTALAESNNWPGLLIWRRRGDSIFLAFGTRHVEEIDRRAHWIFSHLATAAGLDLELLKRQYCREFPAAEPRRGRTLHFLQTSDLHIGSSEADRRIPRIQQIIRNVADELEGSGRVVPVVTGDLMDSDDERHFHHARAFIDFLANLGCGEPLLVLGNHDVRKNGIMLESFQHAIRLPTHSRVVWFDEDQVGVLCFNSVVGGKLARGSIGEEQLLDLGSELDRRDDWKQHTLVGLLHHHPVPVDRPEWYARAFYERILGDQFEKTDALEDADALLRFATSRGIAALLHGHKHIPRATVHDGTAIVGCGSSVGKVGTRDGQPYMSINVVSVDGRERRVTSRLLAERIPGGGLVEQQRHELVLRTRAGQAA